MPSPPSLVAFVSLVFNVCASCNVPAFLFHRFILRLPRGQACVISILSSTPGLPPQSVILEPTFDTRGESHGKIHYSHFEPLAHQNHEKSCRVVFRGVH